jgi:L-threonylcarbamoyladenylate synthase
MHTELIKLDMEPERGIALGARLLREGQLVAFPPEPVYGLGANALDGAAVQKIFDAKGRPSDNPLILHVADTQSVDKLVLSVPRSARRLMDAFWPGPLTIILKKSAIVPDIVTAGLDSAGIRMPGNAYARALIAAAGCPVAAPSANTSGRPSPTCAEHVYTDMDGRIPLILDGGQCRYGVESTVLSLVDEPVILRPGAVTKEMLEVQIGPVKVAPGVFAPLEAGEKSASPGLKYRHYSPKADTVLVGGDQEKAVAAICRLYDDAPNALIIASDETAGRCAPRCCIGLGSRDNPEKICAGLFSALRKADDMGVSLVLLEALDTSGEGMAYMNRALRAAGFKYVIQA